MSNPNNTDALSPAARLDTVARLLAYALIRMLRGSKDTAQASCMRPQSERISRNQAGRSISVQVAEVAGDPPASKSPLLHAPRQSETCARETGLSVRMPANGGGRTGLAGESHTGDRA